MAKYNILHERVYLFKSVRDVLDIMYTTLAGCAMLYFRHIISYYTTIHPSKCKSVYHAIPCKSPLLPTALHLNGRLTKNWRPGNFIHKRLRTARSYNVILRYSMLCCTSYKVRLISTTISVITLSMQNIKLSMVKSSIQIAAQCACYSTITTRLVTRHRETYQYSDICL